MTMHWCAKKRTLGHIGQNDRKLTFFECKWCKNTKKMVGWSGLYNGNEQAQRCRGHPGLLHLQCTHQKIFNTSLISVLSLQILMLTALVVLVFNISAHCAGHLGQLQRPSGEIEEKTEKWSAALQIKEPDITCILIKHLSLPYPVCDP